jgi:molybdopterin/thiamine biosynthesis adenylyltransferase
VRLAIEHDRQAQLLIGGDSSLGYDTARVRLERAALIVSAGEAASGVWGQAALLTIAECATRMFRGGVYLAREFQEPVVVGNRMPIPLQTALVEAGCRPQQAPPQAFALHVGTDIGLPNVLRCWTNGWVATISPRSPSEQPCEGNEISGALAGAMAVSEAFRAVVLSDVRAGRRTQRVSPLTPADPQPLGLLLERLPARCWVLGLGNLGQATLWILGLLRYANPDDVELLLQDADTSGPENLDVQLLTRFSWVGQKKTRAAAAWAEARGFRTVLTERRFTAASGITKGEPRLAFVGVDNLETRRIAAAAGFDLVLDGGLGATSSEVFDIRIHGFPGHREPSLAWPEPAHEKERDIGTALSRLVEEGRIDVCGAIRVAGQSVGIPTTAVAAAAIQVAQACRAIAESAYCDLVDISLADSKRAMSHDAILARPGVLPFARARTGPIS